MHEWQTEAGSEGRDQKLKESSEEDKVSRLETEETIWQLVSVRAAAYIVRGTNENHQLNYM